MHFKLATIIFLVVGSAVIIYGTGLILVKYENLEKETPKPEPRNLISEITDFKKSSLGEKEWEISASKAFIYADKSIELRNFFLTLDRKDSVYTVSGENAALTLLDGELLSLNADGNIRMESSGHKIEINAQVLVLVGKNKAMLEKDVIVESAKYRIKSNRAEVDFDTKTINFSERIWSKIKY